MKKLTILLILAGMATSLSSQEWKAYGYIFDKIDSTPVYNASVEILNTNTKTYTDSLGRFRLTIPEGNHKLMVTHDDFQPINVSLAGPHLKKPIVIRLKSKKTIIENNAFIDSVWKEHKNAISFMPFELIIGSIGIQFERFLKADQSLGLHSSFYLLGWGYSINNHPSASNHFTGIKVSPFYRFYLKRRESKGFFIETQFIAAYIHMNPLLYTGFVPTGWFDGYYITKSKSLTFTTFGAGVAIGWSIKMPNIENGIFNVSIGLQYLTLNVPKTLVDNYHSGSHDTWNVSENWWYIGGPGSILQIRLAYGGIF